MLHLATKGEAVRALYRNETNILKAKEVFVHYEKIQLFDTIEWVKGCLTDVPSLEDAFKGIEYVYHAAALVSFDPDDEDKLRKINIEGTANVVNCALAFGLKKLCFVSSIAALGDLKQGEDLITEETEWNAEKSHSDYAISKHGAEMEVWRGWQEGLDVVIVNPGVIFGYGFWQQGSNRMLHSIKNGQRYYTEGHCGIVAVEDVVAIMVQLMESEVNGERFILVAENMAIQQLFNLLADGMAVKKPSKLAGPALTSFAWRTDWLLSFLLSRARKFTRAMARASHSKEYYGNAKILSRGFQFRTMEVYLKGLATQFVQSGER